MNPDELREYLSIIEMKLQSLLRDIRNIRERLNDTPTRRNQEQLNFFQALSVDDDWTPIHVETAASAAARANNS